MHQEIQHFEGNTTGGRDLIVGDIHGYFSKLSEALFAIGFVPGKDRLFSVGDLADRGPESPQAMNWLTMHWFHAVRGNHEEAAIAFAAGTLLGETFRSWGGGWLVNSPAPERRRVADAFAKLPLAIELETEHGTVVIVHADCPLPEWRQVPGVLTAGGLRADALQASMQWGRDRLKRLFDGPVADVRAVVVGHNEVERFTSLDNVLFIDTGAWNGGHYTILDAHTLRPAEAPSRLDWSGVA